MNPEVAGKLLRRDRNVWGEAIERASVAEVLTLIEPGCAVYSQKVRDDRDFPVGGRVYAVEVAVDPETYETVRWFHVVSTKGGHYVLRKLRDVDIDVDAIELPNPADRLWRGLCKEVASRRGTALPEEGELLGAAHLLYRAVAV